MELETIIARWVAVIWVLAGLSHALHPRIWAALLLPLRERETGGLLLASFNLPLGLAVVLGHNVWVLGIPVIVTIAGWMTTIKSVLYLLFPRAHIRLMSAGMRPGRAIRAIRTIGIVLIILGAIIGYDAFFRR